MYVCILNATNIKYKSDPVCFSSLLKKTAIIKSWLNEDSLVLTYFYLHVLFAYNFHAHAI